MVASIGNVASGTAPILSRVETKNQNTAVEQSDPAAALPATNDDDSSGAVATSESTQAITKVAGQLNAQFDTSRVQAGMQGAGAPHGGGGGAKAAESTSGTDGGTRSTSTDYVAAADTDGDGTVSDAEQAAYDKKLASGQETAQTQQALKAYATSGAAEESSSTVSTEA